MLATSSELQTLAPQLDDHEQVRLLRHRVAGEPFPHSFIHEADAYSAPPGDLVDGLDHAPGTDLGDGKGIAWYFCSPTNCHDGAGGRSTPRRRRLVGGGRGKRWPPEAGKKPILGPDRKSVGAYTRTLSYVSKIKNPAGTSKRFINSRLGWCMVEIGLEQHHGGADQLVLCKVYRSPHTDRKIFMEAISASAGNVCLAATICVSEGGAIPDESLVVPGGGDLQAPPSASPEVARNPAPPSGPAPNYGTLGKQGGEISSSSGVAIVKVAAGARDGEKAVVMKFGRSSVPSAERMKEMAKLIFSYPAGAGQIVAVVLSETGNTTNNILLAVRKAMGCADQKASEIHEFMIIKEMYLWTSDELGLDRSIVSGLVDKLEHYLQHVAITKELTPSTRDYLVSFGDHTSTEMFSEYLNKLGKGTLLVWKDVDGMFTCDPNICENAMPVPSLTFDEAAELSYFAEQSMQLAMEGGISVVVKNSYNPQAPGTVITKTRDMRKSILLTSIVLKSNVTMLDLESTRMLSQYAFVAKAFSIFEHLGIAVDCVATSEGKMSFALVPSKLLSGELIQLELDNVVEVFEKIAVVGVLQHRSVISLIGNAQKLSFILEKALNVLRSINVEVQKFSQGLSKLMTVSLVVDDSEAGYCVRALHSAFFENVSMSEMEEAENECPIPDNSSAEASSGVMI